MHPDFERDGYQIFPGLFSKAEIAVLRAETARLSRLETDTVIRERTACLEFVQSTCERTFHDEGDKRSGEDFNCWLNGIGNIPSLGSERGGS